MLNPLLSVSCPCDQIAEHLKVQLSQNGLKVLQTFDLHDVLSGSEFCSCPNHGTEKCDCDMVVLLVYGSEPEPITVILHGCDGQTQVAFPDDSGNKLKEASIVAIRQTLEGKGSIALQANCR